MLNFSKGIETISFLADFLVNGLTSFSTDERFKKKREESYHFILNNVLSAPDEYEILPKGKMDNNNLNGKISQNSKSDNMPIIKRNREFNNRFSSKKQKPPSKTAKSISKPIPLEQPKPKVPLLNKTKSKN